MLLPAATKLGQGNVFTGVCDSVHRGVSASVHAGIPTPPRKQTPLGPDTPPPKCRAYMLVLWYYFLFSFVLSEANDYFVFEY